MQYKRGIGIVYVPPTNCQMLCDQPYVSPVVFDCVVKKPDCLGGVPCFFYLPPLGVIWVVKPQDIFPGVGVFDDLEARVTVV
jgi:hypothetical protein